MNIQRLREQRIERNWQLIRRTSAISTGVVLTILLVIDAYFRFVSWQLNLTIAFLGIFFLILSRLDLLLHNLVQRIRNKRSTG